MRVALRLDFSSTAASSPSSSARENFWKEYARRNGGEYGPEAGERILYDKLPSKLHEQISHDLEDAAQAIRPSPFQSILPGSQRRYKSLRNSIADLKIQVLDIQYGSIELFLSILGIDGETARHIVLQTLAIYSPVAFNQSLGGKAVLQARAEAPSDMPENAGTGAIPFVAAATSLLVPCGLALAVWFVAYNALTEELKEIRAERAAMSQQQTEALKAIAAENVKLSAMLIEASKGAAATANELEQQQLALVRLRALSEGLLPAGPAAAAPVPAETRPKAP
jgi:hypothetical protein